MFDVVDVVVEGVVVFGRGAMGDFWRGGLGGQGSGVDGERLGLGGMLGVPGRFGGMN